MRRIFGPLALALLLTPALAADNTLLVTPCASGCITPRSKDVGSGVQSMIQILGDTSGNAIYGTAGTANANILSVQGIASMTPLLATVTGSLTNISGTISLPTLASTSTKQSDGSQKSQIVDGSGNVIGATSNALDVNIKSGAGSGGTAIADEAAFTQGTTSLTPIGCLYATSITNLTAGQAGVVRCTNDRTLQVTVANTNANGQAPASASSPVVLPAAQVSIGTAGTAATNVVTVQGIAAGTPVITASNPYPVGATVYTATATGTTGATTATLAGASSVTTYICGFSIRANATAAATGNATVTGVITATLNFTQWTAPNASGLGVTEMIFAPCIPASGTNQSVAVVSAAPGTGGVVSVAAWGYKL